TWVEENVLNHISGETHARTLWSKLEELYACKIGNNKFFLMKQLLALKYAKDTLVVDHENTYQGLLWLLGSLPDTWETFRTSVCNLAPRGVVTLDLAKSSALNEEIRRKSLGSTSQSDVLVTESKGKKGCGSKNKNDSSRSKSTSKFANIGCYHRGKKGHTKKICRQLKREKNKNKNKNKNDEKKNDDNSDEERVATTVEDFLLVYDSETVNLACHETSWVIDTFASTDTTAQKDFFATYNGR
ncbi:hypothetical protein CRG98_050318, partial [Punica granatum]